MVIDKIVLKEPPVLFLPGLAAVIGVNEAILYQHITFQANRVGINVEGVKAWKCSVKSMQEELYFFSIGTLKRTLENLISDGLILKRIDESDRTNCYSTNDERLEHLYELANRKRSLSQKRAKARSNRGVLPHEDPLVHFELMGFLLLKNLLVQNEPPLKQPFISNHHFKEIL